MKLKLHNPFARLLLRWFVNSLGLWMAAGLFDKISYNNKIGVIIIAGLILSIVNSLIRPFVVVLSLPAILFSLGLFIIVVNGLMVLLVSKLYSALRVESFWVAILAGLVIGLVNYLVTVIIEELGRQQHDNL